MEQLTEPTFFVFSLQAIILMSYIPASYVAYKWVRAPMKRDRIVQSLAELGIIQADKPRNTFATEYQTKHYIGPLLLACGLTICLYALTHPYAIQRGWWAGILEEVVNVFGEDNPFPRTITSGRFLFWGWLGAYIYSVHLTYRRFLTYDLTPSVYIFTSNRFWLAMTVGAIVGVGLGTILSTTGVPFNANLAIVSVVVFFIGFFPERGVNWLAITAKRTLNLQVEVTKELRLSEIEGLSMWHQGRLNQEGIENVQNLASADVPALVASTPFTLNQIIDWVDQAVLLVNASQEQVAGLEKVGLRCASDVLTIAEDETNLEKLSQATNLNKNGLNMLLLALQSAPNAKIVSRFKWQSSLDPMRVKKAEQLVTPPTQTVVMDQLFA